MQDPQRKLWLEDWADDLSCALFSLANVVTGLYYMIDAATGRDALVSCSGGKPGADAVASQGFRHCRGTADPDSCSVLQAGVSRQSSCSPAQPCCSLPRQQMGALSTACCFLLLQVIAGLPLPLLHTWSQF